MEDLIIAIFIRVKVSGKRPLRQEIILQDISAKIYLSYWDALILQDGVLFKKWEAPKSIVLQIVFPRKGINQIFEMAHDSGGHFEMNKTLDKIQKHFYYRATCKHDVEVLGVVLVKFV